MKRLDVWLHEMGLAPSRSKAQQLIGAGEIEVRVNGEWRVIDRASQTWCEPPEVRVRGGESRLLTYVSRGGLKLEGALDHLRLDVTEMACLDLGQSTGGFTDCLLKRGARSVTGYDVGHGQLHESLRRDSRVTFFEGVNVRDLGLTGSFDLCVVDLSFISLQKIVASLPPTRVLALVKPQFEAGPGRVLDEATLAVVRAQTLEAFARNGFSVQDYFPSSVTGQEGTQEFFAWAPGNGNL